MLTLSMAPLLELKQIVAIYKFFNLLIHYYILILLNPLHALYQRMVWSIENGLNGKL